jgi:hypothetical protein
MDDRRRRSLRNANLTGADLADADLRIADLTGANLRNADLRIAYLRGADLTDADLTDADLTGADLTDADLRNADLTGADLRNADLCNTAGNKLQVKSLQIEKYSVAYTVTVLQIGCKQYPFSNWWCFSDEEIEAMDAGALEWWRDWKDTIKAIVEKSPATK